MKNAVKLIICSMVFLFIAESAVYSQTFSEKYDLGISAGMILPGRIKVDLDNDDETSYDEKLKTESNFFVRSIADIYISSKFIFGGFINFSPVTLEERQYLGYWDNREHTIEKNGMYMIEAGGTLKYCFNLMENMLLKPGFNFGYRRILTNDKDAQMAGLGINGSLEFQYLVSESYYIYADIGFLTQPYGGVSGIAYMMFDPMIYFTVGVGI